MAEDYAEADAEETGVSHAPVASARLVALFSVDGQLVSVPLPEQGAVTIGRTPTCDVVVPHASVSRHHATLRLAPLAIVDIESRNGTRVRGELIAPNVPMALAPGEAFQLGVIPVFLQSHEIDDQASLATTPDPEVTADAILDEPIARLVDIECARAARSRSPFAYLRVENAGEPARLRATLRASDALGPDGVLLPDTNAEQAQLAVARIAEAIPGVRLGVARYPLDGVTVAQLVAYAHEVLARHPGLPPTAMDEVRALIAQVAQADVSVVITGETGTGKELAAEMIHRQSPRAGKPFVKLNCGAITETLIESELFGHEKGAFTGAVVARAGLFEAGDGGTVFLDEIGELPLSLQAKLLRVLEERIVRRVGATTGKTLDIRVVCATNRTLADEIEAGRFRADLYYRICAVTIAVPPLRARVAEIAGLARAFATSGRRALAPVPVSDEAIAMLERHAWPGNIRELRNVIDRAAILSGGAEISPRHLALDRAPRQTQPTIAMPAITGAPTGATVADLERQHILETLELHGGNQTRAARALGISRNTLLARLDAYGVPRPRK